MDISGPAQASNGFRVNGKIVKDKHVSCILFLIAGSSCARLEVYEMFIEICAVDCILTDPAC